MQGDATERLFPEAKKVAEMTGVRSALSTEIFVPGERPNDHLITFLDTPGLVDGLIGYTYDVEEAIVSLSALADLILSALESRSLVRGTDVSPFFVVFHDPIGQALCARTMRIVKRLNTLSPEKLRFYLSKADTVHYSLQCGPPQSDPSSD